MLPRVFAVAFWRNNRLVSVILLRKIAPAGKSLIFPLCVRFLSDTSRDFLQDNVFGFPRIPYPLRVALAYLFFRFFQAIFDLAGHRDNVHLIAKSPLQLYHQRIPREFCYSNASCFSNRMFPTFFKAPQPLG